MGSTTSRWPTKLLLLLLATDAALILLHVLYQHTGLLSVLGFPQSETRQFLLTRDRGYAELFQYIKEYWIILLLGSLALRTSTGSPLYFSWVLLFSYLLLDDSLLIHERLGSLVEDSNVSVTIYNLRQVDIGQFVVAAFFGLLFLILIGAAYRFGDPTFKWASRYLLLMLAAWTAPQTPDTIQSQLLRRKWL